MTLCTLSHVDFAYPKAPRTLIDISFELPKRSCLALLGASGCGKSTLGQLLAGFLKPTLGQIIWDEEMEKARTPLAMARKKQMIFQDPSSALTPFYTPYKTLEEVIKLHFKLPADLIDAKIVHYLSAFGLEKKLYHQKNHSLSGGEKQRLCLARAFCLEPEFLILDEPLSSCDPFLQKEILLLIKQIQQSRPLSMLVILHDLHHAAYLADQICLLHQGHIESFGPVERFLQEPQTAYTEKFIEAFS